MGPRTATPADAPDHTPKARPCSSPENEAVTSASDPGTMRAPEIPCKRRSTISHSRLGATPLDISQPAGENEKGALAEKISVVDVAFSFQNPHHVRGQIPGNPGQRNGQNARIQKHNPGPENRRPQRSAPVSHDQLSPLNCLRLVRRTAISQGEGVWR